MHLRPVVALVAAALTLGSCSMAFVDAPPKTRPVTGQVACTTSRTYPVLDFVGAGVLGTAAIGIDDSIDERPIYKNAPSLVLLAGGVALLASGLAGTKWVSQCQGLTEELELKRAMRPFEGHTTPAPGRDPWLSAGAPPEGFAAAPAPLAPSPDGGAAAEVGS